MISTSVGEDAATIASVLAHHHNDPTRLLQILREVQEALSWISPAAISQIAAGVRLPRARVEGVAGFYSFFSTRPMGRYRVLFSDNVTDRMLGNAALLERMCGQLWIERGKVSEDGLVSVDTTSCTGMCDQGPALLINGRAITRLDEARVDEICELIRAQTPLVEWPEAFFRVDDNVHRADMLLDAKVGRGEAIRAALAMSGDALIEEVKRSNLRGRGGAGFATGLKWQACRAAPGETRYVVCNADEGEPGTFKDRVLLTRDADLLFEAMTVCAHAISARKGFVYLRGEYRYLLELLERKLTERRALGLLGQSVCGKVGFDFDIEIHLGAGAYVCGEESALIESLEGKRGIPRNRPPFPVTHGYLNQPTVVNNVETLMAAALVALRGARWYVSHGTAKSSGTKLLSVSGDVARPGIYEYPFGVSVREVLEAAGARNPQAVQISGPSGICVDETEFERCIAFEDLPTAGAFMVFDRSRDMFEVARAFAHFFAHESCGFCTPCRVGTSLLVRTLDKIAGGSGSQYDLNEIYQINCVLQETAHCGLGHTACNPIVDTLQRFRPAYERRLKSLDFEPAFDLDSALGPARQMTGRDDAAAHFATEP